MPHVDRVYIDCQRPQSRHLQTGELSALSLDFWYFWHNNNYYYYSELSSDDKWTTVILSPRMHIMKWSHHQTSISGRDIDRKSITHEQALPRVVGTCLSSSRVQSELTNSILHYCPTGANHHHYYEFMYKYIVPYFWRTNWLGILFFIQFTSDSKMKLANPTWYWHIIPIVFSNANQTPISHVIIL